MTDDEIDEAYQYLRRAGVDVEGLHFHLGQAVRHGRVYREAVEHLATLCARIGLEPSYLDCGGGVDHAANTSAAFADLVAAGEWALSRIPSVREVWVENGAYVTRSSAALVVRVLDAKDRPEGRYLICDGGRTNHALDADNGAHRMLALPARSGRLVDTTVCGPTCMTDDRLARVKWPDAVCAGDLVVWLDAGAYHVPWETRFSQGLSAIVWADGSDRLTLARPRETAEQWSSVWTADTP